MSRYTIPCKGIVAYSKHDWKWEDLLTREPEVDEFLVDLIATGVCHTDITGYGGIYPRVLGHEGAGLIISLGSDKLKSKLAEGDLVILSAASCHDCHYCNTGHPAYCQNHAAVTLRANEPTFVLASDKSKVIGGGYFGQSSFANPTPVKVSCAANRSRMSADGHEDMSAALRSKSPGSLGCTHILDTSPAVAVLSGCLEALQNNGTVLQVGVKPVGAKLDLDLLTHMVHGRRLVGVIEGDRDPAEALPELVQWCKGDVIKGVLIW
ncbi:hypothetical protein KVT40_003617 [Elsinoe batatas]|uniref:Alcohol dehydrogenase-like N-terminal domain-containing protein n=1 Tax=Elsinoe batatas TaxID=2601811 RepID=A0A8K0L3E2_9PEZI|nr:hypothetical protein KVT40_003617 [Elsinoe batatas]